MSKTSSLKKRIPPSAFRQYSQTKFERTVQLTGKAIAKLEASDQRVTLTAVCEASRDLDAGGRGLWPITVLRNPTAAEMFRQHSPVYQARQRQAMKAKRKRPQVSSNVRATYRGLRPTEFIQMIEELKIQITELQTQRERLQAQRDEAYQLRDQALQQNARQLAVLTKSTTQVQLTGRPHGP